jgi:hypothetical protein
MSTRSSIFYLLGGRIHIYREWADGHIWIELGDWFALRLWRFRTGGR